MAAAPRFEWMRANGVIMRAALLAAESWNPLTLVDIGKPSTRSDRAFRAPIRA
jgi:hypothetical protein